MSNSSFLARHCTDFPCGSLTLNSCYLIESQIELDKFWRQVRETLLSEISWIPWPTANTVCTRLRLSSQYPLPLASLSPEPQPVGTLSPTFQTFSTHPHLPSSLLLSSIVLTQSLCSSSKDLYTTSMVLPQKAYEKGSPTLFIKLYLVFPFFKSWNCNNTVYVFRFHFCEI